MKIEILKNRNRKEGVLISQGDYQCLLYFVKSWWMLNFNKNYCGWYIMFRICGLGLNFYSYI